ncbi:MAG: rhomboid family intramembrane serine protease [Deltaproteobacteria bacterium]|nr:rhomboid family intramembrane serine protease [Deltaproteobacteria bacterium]
MHEIIYKYLYLHPDSALLKGMIWQFATYMFLHDPDDLMHILFNMLTFYFIAPHLEYSIGKKRFLRFFFLAGFSGAFLHVIAGMIFPSIFSAPAIGASGAVVGVIAAFALKNPHARFYLYFLMPLEARYIIPLILIVDAIFYLSGSNIAVLVHAGGLVCAIVSFGGTSYLKNNASAVKRLFRRRLKVIKRDDDYWN